MSMFRELLTSFGRDENGSTAIEYALLLGLLALAIISAVTTLGQSTSGAFQDAADSYN